MGGGLALEDENAYKGGEGVQKGQFFADVLIECPLSGISLQSTSFISIQSITVLFGICRCVGNSKKACG